MSFIPAKCTQCGANIEADDSRDAGVCPHCQTAFVTQKAINNYNTYITKNIIIDGESKELFKTASFPTLHAAEERCKKLCELGEYTELVSAADEMINNWPESHLGYYWLMRGFDEYHTFGTPEYAQKVKDRLNASAFSAMHGAVPGKHPIDKQYQKFLKRINQDERRQYAEFIIIIEKIIDDFSRALPDIIEKRKRTNIIGFLISFAVFISSLIIGIISLVNDNFLLGLLLIILAAFAALCVGIWFLIAMIIYINYDKKLKKL